MSSFFLKYFYLIKFYIVVVIFLFPITLSAQNLTDAEIKTALVYNFFKYIEHPLFLNEDTLVLGIYGDDEVLFSKLKSIERQKVKGRRIVISKLKKDFSTKNINALFIFTEYNFELSRIYKQIQGSPVLLITDRAEEKREVMINFIHLENNTVQFEINSKNLKDSKFTLSPKLLLHGGTELDIRELYKESEKSLLTEKERTRQAQKELSEKELEVYVLTRQLNWLYSRIDSLNNIIKFQLNDINAQQSTLDSLSNRLQLLISEAQVQKQALDMINGALKSKNAEINELDSDMEVKQRELQEAEKYLKELELTIIEKEDTNQQQQDKIRLQKTALLVFIAFVIVLVLLVIFVYKNFKQKKKQSIELELNNKQINQQKEQIEFQSEELKMKNMELEKLSLVAERTDNAVVILDNQGDIEWVNDGFERMQECKLYEFIENQGKNFVNISNNSQAEFLFKQCLEQKQPVTYNSHITTPRNQKKWLQSTLTPVIGTNREVEKFVIIDTDITKLKEAESKIIKKNTEIEEKAKILTKQTNDLNNTNQELEKQKIRAEKALKKLQNAQSQLVAAEKMASLGQLTSGIAHEINNPINYISSSIEGLINILYDIKVLMSTYDSIDEVKLSQEIIDIKNDIDYADLLVGFDELTSNIKLGVDRTKEIVNSLRIFSRVDEDSYSEVDINKSIESSVILLGKHHKDHITIKENFGNLPKIECMAGKINQVFLNVLVNAVQAIEEKGVIEISTSIAQKKRKDYARIEFKDSGKGMTKETMEKLFEPFYTTKDVGQGTGLGLSITYSIIKKHKGFIDVVSKIGKGTSFNIYLPLMKA